jgi:thiol-disulfide isomerase/thioredoxin
MAIRHFFVSLCGAAVLALAAAGPSYAAPRKGDVAPDFLGYARNSDAVHLNQYAGKAVVISFWASWCPYCLKELPILSNIQKAGKGNIQVVAVNIEDLDTFRKLSRILAPLNLQFAYDPNNDAQDAYGVSTLPHMIIVGRDGKIVDIFHGYTEKFIPQIVASINHATGAWPAQAATAPASPAAAQ